MIKRPFSAIPDIGSFYPSQSAEMARERLFRTLDRGEGLAVLFGETGLGKTLLLRLLAEQFEVNAPVIFPVNMKMTGRKSFLRQILFQLRLPAESNDEDELRITFLDYLRSADYPRFILLIDDGDRLPYSVLEEIRILLDMESERQARFRIAVSGSARFEERLNHPRLASFGQRIASRSWLDPFTRDETVDYIGRQMHRAEGDYDGLAFSPEAARRVHQYSEGIPRIINQVCDLTLYLSCVGDRFIPEKTVCKAWALLEQLPEDSVTVPHSFTPTEGTVVLAGDPVANIERQPLTSCPFPSAEAAGEPSFSPADDSGSVIEFGTLSEEDSADEGVVSSELSVDGKNRDESSADFSEVPETIPFSSAETMGQDGSDTELQILEIPHDENSERETVSIDRNHVEYSDDPSAEDLDGACARSDGRDVETTAEWTDESPDEDEIVDETGADLTYDRLIQERLLRGNGSEEADVDSPVGGNHEEWESLDGETVYPMSSAVNPDSKDRYLEELRLLELEVSQEADLIRKIRGMHSGLESFRMDDAETVSRPRGYYDVSRTSAAVSEEAVPRGAEDRLDSSSRSTSDSVPLRGRSANGAEKTPSVKKKRPFLHIFEKIYPEDGSANR